MQNKGPDSHSTSPSPFTETRHICAFFSSDDEEYRVLTGFIMEGFTRGEKAVHVVNPDQYKDHVHRLSAKGIDVVDAQRRGQLELHTNTETYLPDGRFDQDRMLEAFERMASGNNRTGFPRSRIICRMDWAAASQAYINDLIEFESRVNDVWQRHNDTVICTYQLRKFGADAVIDIMRTHPVVIVGGTLHQNPFFVPPQKYLQELRERRMSGPNYSARA